MGAQRFDTIVSGETMEEAYCSAVAAAQWEYGHGGYTGTIAEKNGFVDCGTIADDEAVTTTLAALNATSGYYSRQTLQLAADLSEAYNDKWGPALGFRIESTDSFLFCGYASC